MTVNLDFFLRLVEKIGSGVERKLNQAVSLLSS